MKFISLMKYVFYFTGEDHIQDQDHALDQQAAEVDLGHQNTHQEDAHHLQKDPHHQHVVQDPEAGHHTKEAVGVKQYAIYHPNTLHHLVVMGSSKWLMDRSEDKTLATFPENPLQISWSLCYLHISSTVIVIHLKNWGFKLNFLHKN